MYKSSVLLELSFINISVEIAGHILMILWNNPDNSVSDPTYRITVPSLKLFLQVTNVFTCYLQHSSYKYKMLDTRTSMIQMQSMIRFRYSSTMCRQKIIVISFTVFIINSPGPPGGTFLSVRKEKKNNTDLKQHEYLE